MRHFGPIAVSAGLLVAVGYALSQPVASKPAPVVVQTLPLTPVEAPSESPVIAVNAPISPPVTLRDCADRLAQGRTWLQSVPEYTAVFRKQERVGSQLHPLEVTELKLRHVPFSVALKWPDNGRIVFYRNGVDQNRITVRLGGWKQRFGWIHLDPHSNLALQESRYPVTDVGLLRLTEQLLDRFVPYLDRADGVHCEWRTDDFVGGRLCRVFLTEYASAVVNPDYRKSIVWLDAEWSVPLAVENFDWETGDSSNPEGLVEYYAYENIQLLPSLAEGDFSISGTSVAAPDVAAKPGME